MRQESTCPAGSLGRWVWRARAPRDSARELFRGTRGPRSAPLAHSAPRSSDLLGVGADARIVHELRGVLATMLLHLGDRTAADLALRPTQLRLTVVALAGDVGLPVGAPRLIERQVLRPVACPTGIVGIAPRRTLLRDVLSPRLRRTAVDVARDPGVATRQDTEPSRARRALIERQGELVAGPRF